MFEKVKEQRGIEAMKKSVTVIIGDVSLPGLGISAEDKKMLCEKVNIVYHAAATVRWKYFFKSVLYLMETFKQNKKFSSSYYFSKIQFKAMHHLSVPTLSTFFHLWIKVNNVEIDKLYTILKNLISRKTIIIRNWLKNIHFK